MQFRADEETDLNQKYIFFYQSKLTKGWRNVKSD